MRITQRMMSDQMIQHTNENMERLAHLQSLGASEKKFTNFSDNPAAAAASLSLRSTLSSSQSYLDTAILTDEWMSASEVALEKLESLASRFLIKVRGAATDSLGADERKVLAGEVDAALKDAISSANARHQDSYLFSGFKITTQPFVTSTEDPNVIAYQGDNEAIQRNIAPNQKVTVNVDGIFDSSGAKIPTSAVFTNFFASLQQAAGALRGIHPEPEPDAEPITDTEAVENAASAIEAAFKQLSELRGVNGARQRHILNTIGYIEDTQLALGKSLSDNENVNLAEVIAQIRQQETVLQAVLEVSSRTMATANLFQYLG